MTNAGGFGGEDDAVTIVGFLQVFINWSQPGRYLNVTVVNGRLRERAAKNVG